MDKQIAMEVFYIFEGQGIQPGSFTELLIRTINAADAVNKIKLSREFPEYVEAVSAYKTSEASYEELRELAFGEDS